MSMGRRQFATLTVAVALVFSVAAGLTDAAGAVGRTAKAARVPATFFGMNVDGPALSPRGNLAKGLQQMYSSGVRSVRLAFDWAQAQPYASKKDVPAGQRSLFTPGPNRVPTNFERTDILVGGAALRGLSMIPTVLYAPRWDASK